MITLGDGQPDAVADDGVRFHVLPDELLDHVVEQRWPLAADRTLRSLPHVDVVFAAEWGADAWRYAVRPQRAPLVTNLQTSTVQLLKGSPGVRPWSTARPRFLVPRTLERLQARRSQLILGCSRFVLDWAEQLWPIAPVPRAVLHNSVDVDGIRELARGPMPDGMPTEGPLIVFAGRLDPRKGVDLLVAAMHTVWDRHPRASVAFFGRDGTWAHGAATSDHLRELAGPHRRRLVFFGDRDHSELMPALARADVAAFPSVTEALALVALEALALGTPLVVGSGTGMAEVVRDGSDGYVVDPRDTGAVGGALLRLIENPELARRMGESAARHADDFTAARAAERFEQLCAEHLRVGDAAA